MCRRGIDWHCILLQSPINFTVFERLLDQVSLKTDSERRGRGGGGGRGEVFRIEGE